MTTKLELKGSFGSLIDTLTRRFDPLQPEDIVVKWIGLITRCAACSRDTAAWDALPAKDDRFEAVVQALDRGARAMVMADYSIPASLHAALDVVSSALDRLEGLLS